MDGEKQSGLDAVAFLKDVQSACQIHDDLLAEYIEEARQTLMADYLLRQHQDQESLDELLSLDFIQLEQRLTGHPKLIMNKGRLGWGIDDINQYAPECQGRFRLRFLAVHPDICLFGIEQNLFYEEILADVLGESEFRSVLEQLTGPFSEYRLVGVHPWQWQRYIATQFMDDLCHQQIIDLGERGPIMTPQSSIRTLSEATGTGQYDIKVALSILNTSCVRGIPQKYIEVGPKISTFVDSVVKNDPFLQEVRVLKEVASIAVPHDGYQDIKDASYRYKELLGCVWRESVASKIAEDETAIPVSALLHLHKGESYFKALVQDSGMTVTAWVKCYSEKVVLPLYHLQVRHGLGLVAHGQNTILVLKRHCPAGLIIKDFHGDLRASTSSPHLPEIQSLGLDQLPPEHLIHDLVTGHLASVLRYFSALCQDHLGLLESDFYQILKSRVETYHAQFGAPQQTSLSLLRPTFEKVLVNKVRFHAGYKETGVRLKPMLGTLINNPIMKQQEVLHVHL